MKENFYKNLLIFKILIIPKMKCAMITFLMIESF